MTAPHTPTEQARQLLAQGMEVMPKDHHVTHVSAQWLESLQAVVADLADEVDRLRAEMDHMNNTLDAVMDERDELRAELDRRTDPDLATRLRQQVGKYDGQQTRKGFIILNDVAAAARLIDGKEST